MNTVVQHLPSQFQCTVSIFQHATQGLLRLAGIPYEQCVNLKRVNVALLKPRLNQIRSVAQSCLTLCDPINRSKPGLPVHHQLPEFTGTHIHRVSDAIQPSHPLLSPSPLAPNPSQHQSLFQ